MNYLEQTHAGKFFADIIKLVPVKQPGESVVVTHLLEDRPWFLHAINEIAKVRCVIPKPKSINPAIRDVLQHEYKLAYLTRDNFSISEAGLSSLKKYCHGERLVLLDIGGYFANLAFSKHVKQEINLLGIVEDTENGHLKYLQGFGAHDCSLSIASVARSKLKIPENYLVGQSVVFSSESLLRSNEKLLHGMRACVIGYGNIGKSVAQHLRERHVHVHVYDIDPVKRIEAYTHGFSVTSALKDVLPKVDVIFCITGNKSLDFELFETIKSGAYIACVTSPDDELALEQIKTHYNLKHTNEFITEYSRVGQRVYLLNRGQAVNFLHGSVVGSFIQLLQAEIVVATALLLNGELKPGLQEVPAELQQKIADCWLACFCNTNNK